jgi:hypothetical protein
MTYDWPASREAMLDAIAMLERDLAGEPAGVYMRLIPEAENWPADVRDRVQAFITIARMALTSNRDDDEIGAFFAMMRRDIIESS